jgi:small-conductance mechanosensitive channel
MRGFLLISSRKKFTLFIQLVALVSVYFSMHWGLYGNYLPYEFWAVVRLYLFTALALGLLRAFMVTSYRTQNKLAINERDNFTLGTDSLATLVTFFITFAGTLVILDIDFKEFLTSLSLVAVALVLIFRDYISNYLDSFRLMFSTDFKIGNYIRVGESTKGVINDISFRATKLKTDEGDVLFIPNTRLITSEVVNYSKVRYKRITVPFSLPTEVVHPVDTLESHLKQKLLSSFPELIAEKKIFLRVLNIKEWHTDFALEVSIDQYSFAIEDKVVKSIYTAVLAYQSDNTHRLTLHTGRHLTP